MPKNPVVTLRVAGKTNVGKLAGSISKNLMEGNIVEAIAIGAPAVNQLVKAIATSRGHLGSTNKKLRSEPSFLTTPVRGEGGEEDRTALMFTIILDE